MDPISPDSDMIILLYGIEYREDLTYQFAQPDDPNDIRKNEWKLPQEMNIPGWGSMKVVGLVLAEQGDDPLDPDQIMCYCEHCGFGKDKKVDINVAEKRTLKDCPNCGQYAWQQE